MRRSSFVVDTFSCPKNGNTSEDYEDASAVVQSQESCRVAIADGATESSFSKLWASLLVETYVQSEVEGPEFFYELEAPRKAWKAHVGQKQLPWYAEEKAGLGAFSALLCFSADLVNRRWAAVAVGDCCLFQLDSGARGARLVESFPLHRSDDFGFSPFLLGTNPEKTEDLDQHIKVLSGTMRPDDIFLFASDAISAWLLRRHEDRNSMWGLMSEISSPAEFGALVDVARENDELHNDDSTLVRLVYRG